MRLTSLLPSLAVLVNHPTRIGLRLGALAACTALGATAAEQAPEAIDPNAPRFVPTEKFALPEGLEITLWAKSPLLSKPTNIDVDAAGRIWVAEGVNYRSHAGRRKEGDRIVVLEDTDGDGTADKSTVFVQDVNLVAPLGVAVIGDQVVVSQPPDLLVYTDVNHNGVFDVGTDTRDVLLTGFNGRNHDHSLHSLTAGPDGQWYFNQGNTGAQFTDKSGKTFYSGSWYDMSKTAINPPEIAGKTSSDGHIYTGGFTVRMNPDGTNASIVGYNYRNSYEQTITSLGDVFQSDNDDPPACRVTAVMEYGSAGFNSRDGKRSWNADRRPGQTTPIAEWRQDDPGTMPSGDVYGGGSPTGVAFYENGALGDKWNGLLLACEAGRNVIFGYFPKPNGAGFTLERTDFLTSNTTKVFAGSDFMGGKANDELITRFRPSDVVIGADGAIYVADWFDPRVGGHQSLDKTLSGNIYRIAPKGFKPHVPKIDLATTAGQIEALKSPAVNVRNSGFVHLKAQGEAAVPAVAALLSDANHFIAARAIWLLAQLGPAGVAKVEPLLASKDEEVRVVAYRALRRADHAVLAMAARLATDPSAAVRREVATSLRDVPAAQSVEILTALAKSFDGKDRAYLEAFGIGSSGKEREVYASVAKTIGSTPESWSPAFAWITWRLSAPAAVADLRARALAPAVPRAMRKQAMDALAFIADKTAADAMLDLAQTKDFPFTDLATWWLFKRKDNDWKEFGVADEMKRRGIFDPEHIVLTPIISPEPPAGPSKLPAIPELQKLAGDAARGKTAVAVCYGCHHIGGQGAEFGPDLTSFGLTQPSEVIINAIVNPSAEISHGYEGTHIVTKDDQVIDGIVLSSGDPVIVKSMGGIVQTIPRGRIKSLEGMKRSLMLGADQLGLSAQTVADIVAYLKSGDVK